MTPELLAAIDRAMAGEAPPVATDAIPPWYASAEDAYQQWVVMAERMIPLDPMHERFYRGGLAYWDRRRRGEDVGPVPNTRAPVSGAALDWGEECTACQ